MAPERQENGGAATQAPTAVTQPWQPSEADFKNWKQTTDSLNRALTELGAASKTLGNAKDSAKAAEMAGATYRLQIAALQSEIALHQLQIAAATLQTAVAGATSQAYAAVTASRKITATNERFSALHRQDPPSIAPIGMTDAEADTWLDQMEGAAA